MHHPAATPSFWHERWTTNQIGFHLAAPNPHLLRWWPTLNLHSGAKVLVPLCGKTHDLAWLAGQGHDVVGVELSPLASSAFFAEHGLVPTVEARGPFTAWSAGNVTILEGDVFALSEVEPLSGFAAVWDRAALIALPPELRDRYLREVRVAGPHLVVTMVYDQARRDGPPFSVPDEVVLAAWPAATKLHSEALDDERWRDLGGVVETVWLAGGYCSAQSNSA